MGNKRVGLARTQALLENLKRDLNWGGSSMSGTRMDVVALANTAAITRTLTVEESGTLFTVNCSAVDNNIALTLPAASGAAGVYYDFCFLVNSDDDADFSVTTGDDDVDIFGGVTTLAANSKSDAFNGISKITVDASVAVTSEGMRLSLFCDGANWHLDGHLATAIGTVHLVGAASA